MPAGHPGVPPRNTRGATPPSTNPHREQRRAARDVEGASLHPVPHSGRKRSVVEQQQGETVTAGLVLPIWPLHLVTRSARQDRLRISHPCVHRGEKPQESYIQVSNTLSRSQRQAKCLLSLPALACPSHPDGPELLGGARSRGTSPPLPRADLQEVCHKEDVSLCNFLTAPGRIIIPRGSARLALDPFTRGGWDHCPQQQQVASFPKTSAHLRAAQPRPQGLVLGARCRLALNNRALSLPAGSPAS